MSKLDKYYRQRGGEAAILENKEYIKTDNGQVLKIMNAPKHEDSLLKIGNKNKKVPFGRGGVVVPNVKSALSATHENRSSKDRLYTYKDEEIKIMPKEVEAIGKLITLPVKFQKKAISPAKLLDLLIEKRNTTIKKYKDPIAERKSDYRLKAIEANRAVLSTLPTKEDLYDIVFKLQESKKSGEFENAFGQTGVNFMGYFKDPKYTPIVAPKIERFPINPKTNGFFSKSSPDVINIDPNQPDTEQTLEHENIHRNQFYRGDRKNYLNNNLFNSLSNKPPYNQEVYDLFGNADEAEAYLSTNDNRDVYDNYFTKKNKEKFMNSIIKQQGGELSNDTDFIEQNVLTTMIAKNPSISKFLKPKVNNNQSEKRLLDITKTGNSNIVRGQQNLERFNIQTEQGYVKDPILLTIKDLKYNKRHNQSTPQTLVRDIARAAKVSEVPLETALAIAQRETGLGSQTYHPQAVYSNWEQRHMGIPNSTNLDPGEQLTEKELAAIKAYEKNSLKYPFASEMDTIKKKTSKFGLRGYNYGDPDYPNKIAQEIEILRNPINSGFMKYADSVYNATPKNFFDKKQTGGYKNKLKKYIK